MISTSRSPGLQRIATVALAGIAYYAVIVILLHFLRPDVSPFSQFTSDYTVGRFGLLMTSAFFVLSMGSFALVLGLYQGVSQPARSALGLVFLGIWAAGLAISGLFPFDPLGAPRTLGGTIAQLNGPIHVLSLVIGAILVSRRFKYDEIWRPVHRFAVVVSLIMLVAFTMVLPLIATGSVIAGLGQRIFVLAAISWLLLTAKHLRSIPPRTPPA